MSMERLFQLIQSLEGFDSEHFWRLTPHRVRQLVESYYLQNDGVDSLASMLQREKAHRS